ncbi:MAG: hypothetical protein ACREIV_01875, partial [Planctomycetaceae bacterium]
YAALERNGQFAQMKIWIGRLRQLQSRELADEERELSESIFISLREMSEHYRPGHIEAFRKDFTADWDAFIEQAQRELDASRRQQQQRREAERQRIERERQEEQRRRQVREDADAALAELKEMTSSDDLPRLRTDQFHSLMRRVISGFGTADEQVHELVRPYRDLLEGQEFRAMRRHMERIEHEQNGSAETLSDEDAGVLQATRGMVAVLIGGGCREDARLRLERLFEFDHLEWEDYERPQPAKLKSMKERIRNGGMDLVLILKAFIAHHVSEQLRPLCEQHGIPCLMVEQGYGPRQVAQALRKGLLKS